MPKYVVITGGVVSGVGKGITVASLGRLLKARGYKVQIQKFDPYINVDSSNLSPFQHGEIFVTDDGAETDLVLGHYERFMGEPANSNSIVTSGKVYSSVIENERKGKYNGRTVQIVPHITDEIKARLLKPQGDEIVLVDVGGTVGDMECQPFLEAFKQLRVIYGKDNVAYVHVSFVPYIEMSGEQKTKPTQHSVKELQNVGIQPDVIVCRSDYPLAFSSKQKMAAFCNVAVDCIIENLTNKHVLDIPLKLEQQGFASVVLRRLKLDDKPADLSEWKEVCRKAYSLGDKKKCKLAVVGKYVTTPDAYISLFEALKYSAIELSALFEISWIASDKLDDKKLKTLSGYDGIIIPAGFGERGFDGKNKAAQFARENDIPCLMIGLGAQAGLVDFSRDVCGLGGANSQEFDENAAHPVVCFGSEFKKGAHKTLVTKNTKLASIYKKASVKFRHRHKFEMNPDYADTFEKHGLVISGKTEYGQIDAYELPDKKFYIGVSYHPEFAAWIAHPDKLITEFMKTALEK